MTLGSLGRVDETGSRWLYPGDYSLMVDTQPLATANFTLTGSATCLDDWPQPPAPQRQDSDYFVGGYGSTYDEELLVDGNVP
jgi:beta-D-xylosidase 4